MGIEQNQISSKLTLPEQQHIAFDMRQLSLPEIVSTRTELRKLMGKSVQRLEAISPGKQMIYSFDQLNMLDERREVLRSQYGHLHGEDQVAKCLEFYRGFKEGQLLEEGLQPVREQIHSLLSILHLPQGVDVIPSIYSSDETTLYEGQISKEKREVISYSHTLKAEDGRIYVDGKEIELPLEHFRILYMLIEHGEKGVSLTNLENTLPLLAGRKAKRRTDAAITYLSALTNINDLVTVNEVDGDNVLRLDNRIKVEYTPFEHLDDSIANVLTIMVCNRTTTHDLMQFLERDSDGESYTIEHISEAITRAYQSLLLTGNPQIFSSAERTFVKYAEQFMETQRLSDHYATMSRKELVDQFLLYTQERFGIMHEPEEYEFVVASAALFLQHEAAVRDGNDFYLPSEVMEILIKNRFALEAEDELGREHEIDFIRPDAVNKILTLAANWETHERIIDPKHVHYWCFIHKLSEHPEIWPIIFSHKIAGGEAHVDRKIANLLTYLETVPNDQRDIELVKRMKRTERKKPEPKIYGKGSEVRNRVFSDEHVESVITEVLTTILEAKGAKPPFNLKTLTALFPRLKEGMIEDLLAKRRIDLISGVDHKPLFYERDIVKIILLRELVTANCILDDDSKDLGHLIGQKRFILQTKEVRN